jgi:hypothetical protein
MSDSKPRKEGVNSPSENKTAIDVKIEGALNGSE